jgi:hypothetical protein
VCAAAQTTSSNTFKLGSAVEANGSIGRSELERIHVMVYAIAGVLLSLWVIGVATNHSLGGFVDMLPIVAVIMVMLNLIGRRRLI